MAYTGTEIFKRAITILDELSDAGTVSDTQTREYKNKAPDLLDLWQHENADLHTTIEILRRPAVNLLGTRFEVREHVTADVTFEASRPAASGAFTVDNEADVYVEYLDGGAWTGAEGFYAVNGGEETAFTGLIAIGALTAPAAVKFRTTAAGTAARLRFAGSWHYLFSSFALFAAAYPSCGRVPDYGEFVRYPMPADFDRPEQLTAEGARIGLQLKWENGRDLMVDYFFSGTIKVTYRRNPAKIEALTQTLEISESAAAAGAYYLAMHFALGDQNTDLAAMCQAKYLKLLEESDIRLPLAPVKVHDAHGVSWIR